MQAPLQKEPPPPPVHPVVQGRWHNITILKVNIKYEKKKKNTVLVLTVSTNHGYKLRKRAEEEVNQMRQREAFGAVPPCRGQ